MVIWTCGGRLLGIYTNSDMYLWVGTGRSMWYQQLCSISLNLGCINESCTAKCVRIASHIRIILCIALFKICPYKVAHSFTHETPGEKLQEMSYCSTRSMLSLKEK